MANFLRDYINHRGEDTVIRTQFGILDKDTGEHLVPVQHANLYFSDMELIRIKNSPNMGYVSEEEKIQLPAPIWNLIQINGANPIGTEIYDADGIPGNISFTGEISWSDGSTYGVTEVEFFKDGVKTKDAETEDGGWTWTDAVTPGTYEFKISGKTEQGGNVSEDAGDLVFKVKIWRAPEWSTNLPAAPSEYAYGSQVELKVKVNSASAPTPYAFDWKKGNTSVGYANTDTMIFNSVSSNDTGVYSCTVTDAIGRTLDSRNHTMTVYSEMKFDTDLPQTGTVSEGSPQTYTVAVSGGKAPYTYQWKHVDAQQTVNDIGTNSPTYEIVSAGAGDVGVYYCNVTDSLNTLITSKHSALVVTSGGPTED